jgi:transposase-like protein
MSIVVLQLPDVKRGREVRPQKCPYCEGETFQRWGQVRKPVRDLHCRGVRVYRYRCCRCRRTFRHYPEGTSRADQSERLKQFAVVCWRLGLSHRGVSLILSGLKLSLSHMSVWRDVQAVGEGRQGQDHWKKVRVLGVDGAYVLGWGQKRPVLVAVDMGDGQVVALGHVDEHDPQAVRRWLEPVVQQHGVSVIVTDDLSSYRLVAERLQLGHQVCQFHVRRWVGRALKELHGKLEPAWHPVLDEVKQLISDLPAEGDKRLYALWQQVSVPRLHPRHGLRPIDQLRELLIRLSENWSRYCLFYSEPEIPWTNNPTEQAIGRMKMRARTVRGYKSWPGMQNGLLLAASSPA